MQVIDIIGRTGTVVSTTDTLVVFKQANGTQVQMPKWAVRNA